MANGTVFGNANGTHFTDTKHPPVNWAVNATISQTKQITIRAGESASDALDFTTDDLTGYSPAAVFTAANWSTAKMGIEVSYDGTNWFSAHTWFNGAYDTQNNCAPLSCHTIDGYPLRGMPFVRFVSGTTSVRVNQTNTTILTILIGTI